MGHITTITRTSSALFAIAATLSVSGWQPALGPGDTLDGEVHDLHLHVDSGGPGLYAAGAFSTAGGVAANRVARWDGAAWSALGGGFDDTAYALVTYDDGTGPALYAGGLFEEADGSQVNHVARWDGAAWSALDMGVQFVGHGDTYVGAFEVFDDGSGPSLFVAGRFNLAGGLNTYNVARWDGVGWNDVGGGTNNGIFDLAVFDDGAGPALYAGGFFTEAGGVPATGIARWDGVAWSPVGNDLAGGVNALCVFDDGSGPALYAGGTLRSAPWAPAPFRRVARFDGIEWSPVGRGVAGPFGAKVNELCVYDDGSGPALYAGGIFWAAGGVRADNIARWDGDAWSPLGAGVSARVDTLEVAISPSGSRTLYVGGAFQSSPAGDAYMARWQ